MTDRRRELHYRMKSWNKTNAPAFGLKIIEGCQLFKEYADKT